MATKRERIRDPKRWQVLGTVIAAVALLKDAPTLIRRMVPWRPDGSLRRALLAWGSGDFWLSWAFLVLAAVVAGWVLWPSLPQEEKPGDVALREKIASTLRRQKLVRVLRSFGLVLVREWLLDRLGVALYDTFRRPSSNFGWPAEPERFDSINRINFTDGTGREYQYPRYFGQVFVREHPAASSTLGAVEQRALTWRERGVLLIGSNFYPFWVLQQYLWAVFFRRHSDMAME